MLIAWRSAPPMRKSTPTAPRPTYIHRLLRVASRPATIVVMPHTTHKLTKKMLSCMCTSLGSFLHHQVGEQAPRPEEDVPDRQGWPGRGRRDSSDRGSGEVSTDQVHGSFDALELHRTDVAERDG